MASPVHALRVIGHWIDYYNQQHPHQTLKMMTPEAAYAATLPRDLSRRRWVITYARLAGSGSGNSHRHHRMEPHTGHGDAGKPAVAAKTGSLRAANKQRP